jgi:hypothetical protein
MWIGWQNKDVEFTRLLAQKCGNIRSLTIFVWIVGILVYWMSSFYFLILVWMILWATLCCFGVFGFWIIIWLWFHLKMSGNILFLTIFRIFNYWFFNMVLIVCGIWSLLFLNMVSCFESNWVSIVAFKLWFLSHWCFWFWVYCLFWVSMNGSSSISFVFGFEVILGALLFLILS